MNLLCEAIALNNEGSMLLRDGDSTTSTAFFQRAVGMIRAFNEELACGGRDSEWTMSNLRRSEATTAFNIEPNNGKCVDRSSDGYYIYDRPLLLSSDVKITCYDDLESVVLIASSSIIFNMALSWHQQGKSTGNALALTKAGHLYDLVLSLLDDASGEDASYKVMKLLTLNNHVQLSNERGDFDSSLTFAMAMRDILESVEVLYRYIGGAGVQAIRLNIYCVFCRSAASAA